MEHYVHAGELRCTGRIRMAKKKETVPNISDDFNKLKSLLDEGRLESTLAKLDPEDLERSIKRVPKELIRLMVYLLFEVKDVDDKVRVLKPEQRIPIASLLDLARKDKGLEFSQVLLERIGIDEKIAKDIGFVFRKHKDPIEIKACNSISHVRTSSELNLKQKRLYTELFFMQGEDVLLKSNAEIDEVLGIVSQILNGAVCTLDLFKKNTKGVNPQIYSDSCREYLKKINNYSTFLSDALNELEKSLIKTKKKKKVKSKVVARTSKTKKKKKVKSKTLV
jgi:hypothetical protein